MDVHDVNKLGPISGGRGGRRIHKSVTFKRLNEGEYFILARLAEQPKKGGTSPNQVFQKISENMAAWHNPDHNQDSIPFDPGMQVIPVKL